jgi:hypothetical protein
VPWKSITPRAPVARPAVPPAAQILNQQQQQRQRQKTDPLDDAPPRAYRPTNRSPSPVSPIRFAPGSRSPSPVLPVSRSSSPSSFSDPPSSPESRFSYNASRSPSPAPSRGRDRHRPPPLQTTKKGGGSPSPIRFAAHSPDLPPLRVNPYAIVPPNTKLYSGSRSNPGSPVRRDDTYPPPMPPLPSSAFNQRSGAIHNAVSEVDRKKVFKPQQPQQQMQQYGGSQLVHSQSTYQPRNRGNISPVRNPPPRLDSMPKPAGPWPKNENSLNGIPNGISNGLSSPALPSKASGGHNHSHSSASSNGRDNFVVFIARRSLTSCCLCKIAIPGSPREDMPKIAISGSGQERDTGLPRIALPGIAPAGSDLPSIALPGDNAGIENGPRINVPQINIGNSGNQNNNGNDINNARGYNNYGAAQVRKGATVGLACGGCGGPIVGRIVSAMGNRWHPECFRCCECNESLEYVSSYEHDGRPYCHLDYHEVCPPFHSYSRFLFQAPFPFCFASFYRECHHAERRADRALTSPNPIFVILLPTISFLKQVALRNHSHLLIIICFLHLLCRQSHTRFGIPFFSS